MTELHMFTIATVLLCATCIAVRLVATPFIRPRYRRSDWFEGVLWAERVQKPHYADLADLPDEMQRGVADYLSYRHEVLRPTTIGVWLARVEASRGPTP